MTSRLLRSTLAALLGLLLLLPGPAVASLRVCPMTGEFGFVDPCLSDGCGLTGSDAVAEASSCCTGMHDAVAGSRDPSSEERPLGVAPSRDVDCCIVVALGTGAPVSVSAPAPSLAAVAPVAFGYGIPRVSAAADEFDFSRARVPLPTPPSNAPLVLRV